MHKLKLNDGTEFDVHFCSAMPDNLTIGLVSSLSFIQVAEIFADASKTRVITFTRDDVQRVLEDYTNLSCMNSTDLDDGYLLILRRVTK